MGPGSFDRRQALRQLASRGFDVVVVGGGVTGCGVALDAAARGLRTALVERDDFASGTSSRSSKMAHGGLRYLQQGEVRLVYEALAERERLRRNAPHLVRVLEFVIPVLSRDGTLSRKVARALGSALWMYDLTGGLRSGRRHRRLGRAAVLERLPGLRADRVVGGYLYVDAQVDDARLTLCLARTAALDHGAVVANRVEVEGLRHGADGNVSGVHVVDRMGGERFVVATRWVVNATGVWADDVLRFDRPGHATTLRPAKGVHVTLPASVLPATAAVVLPVPKDRRSVFVVPWEGATFVGTTDTDYDGPLHEPTCTAEDVEYLLGAVNAALATKVTAADVIGTWAGLRPLLVRGAGAAEAQAARTARGAARGPGADGPGAAGLVADADHLGPVAEIEPGAEVGLAGDNSVAASGLATAASGLRAAASELTAAASGRTADLSRAHRVDVSPSGVVTVTGGKLTTYRRMAADAVDAVVERLDERARLRARRSCPTKRLRLRGANGYAEARDRGDGVWEGPPALNRHLADRYGGEARVLLAMLARDPSLAEPLVADLPYLRAEAVYAVRYEMANGVEDVLSRRCRALLLAAERAAEAAETVATLIGPELGWSTEDAAREAAAFRALVASGRRARGASPTGRADGAAEEPDEPIA